MKKGYAKVEIFKPGTHTTSHGEAITFTEADVAATAAAYDPATFEAPMVVGHPQMDAPAYGWVKSLDFTEGKLRAEGHQVEPQFAELVRDGRFKKVSARFYRPDSPDNPKPGVWYLRHVGFLGAAAPAVKGLKPAAFASREAGTVDVEFGEADGWDLNSIAAMFRRLREAFIEKFGRDEADKALPSWQVTELEDAARRRTEEAPAGPVFSQSSKEDDDVLTKEQLEQKEQELKDREAAFTEKEKKQREGEAEARKADAAAFCEDLVKGGKLLPAKKDRMAAFMSTLSAETAVEFGEGDGKKSESQLAAFKAIARDLKPVIAFGEVAGTEAGDPPQDGKQEVSFSESLTNKV